MGLRIYGKLIRYWSVGQVVEDQCSDERGMDEEKASCMRWLREVAGAAAPQASRAHRVNSCPSGGIIESCKDQKILLTEPRISMHWRAR